METLLKDIRFGARVLIKNRGSTALSVMALALGIGLCGMMFSIVWGGVLRGLPFEKPEQILSISRANITEPDSRMSVSIHDFEDWRAQQRSFTDIGGFYTGTVNVSGAERPERFDGAFITPQAFTLVGAKAEMGRLLNEADAAPGAEPVMLLGHDTWQNYFEGDPNILGRVVRANGRPTTIVGIMPADFGFPNNEQVWVPLPLNASTLPRNEGMWINVFGRLRDDVTADQAAVEFAGIAKQLADAYPETNREITTLLQPYVRAYIGDEPVIMLFTMLGAVFMVLLIACANVANLLISRAAARSREVGIRTAMGASKTRIVRQFLTESFILSISGALIGLGIAYVGTRLFSNAIADTDPPFWIDIRLDPAVLLFVTAVTALASVISGAIPAWQAARANVADVLKDESRGASSFRLGRISRILVVAEIALSAGLLVGAGLMIKSVTRIKSVDFAFAADDVFTARVGLPEVQYPDTATQARFFESLLPRLRQDASMQAVGLISSLPGTSSGMMPFRMEGTTYQEDRDFPMTRTVMMSPGALAALDVELLAGRDFTEQDRRGALPVAIVNQAFATRHFNGNAIGRRIRLGGRDSENEWLTIVGMVPDMYVGGLDGDETPQAVYTPLLQGSARFMSIVARGRGGDPLTLAQPVRAAVQAVDSDLPIYFVDTLREVIDSDNWFYMVFGTLFMVFGGVALFLASVGLYGVMSTSVSQRTREMGVRMALGAEGGDVLKLVMRQGLIQLAIGLVLGLAFALGLSNLLQMLLFEVNPRDPSIFAAIGVVLTATAAAACLVPALRATRVHPMASLRYD